MSTPFHMRYTFRAAEFSGDGRYRYRLVRRWELGGPDLHVVGLNPSTADTDPDDPTVRRIAGLAKAAGYAGLELTNLFAYRATSPADMRAQAAPVGRYNNKCILRCAKRCEATVVAWGTHGAFRDRAEVVLDLLEAFPLRCWGTTMEGFPRHPLYLRGDTPLVGFGRRVAA